MFNLLKNLSLFSILTIVLLFIASIVSITTSYITLRDYQNNDNFQKNNLVANNYANSLSLAFKFITSPLKYGQEYMSRYSIFNSTLNDFISTSTLNQTSANNFVNSLSLYYIVRDIDRQMYENKISELSTRPITFTDYIESNKSIIVSPQKDFYLPSYFTVPVTNNYIIGLDVLSFRTYNKSITDLLNSKLSTVVINSRVNLLNQTLLDFGTNTQNGIVVVTLIIENIIKAYILDNEKISLKYNNKQFFTNCNDNDNDNCIENISKDITLPNGEILVATIFFNNSSMDITTFLFVLIGVLLVVVIVLFIVFNFEIQRIRFVLADKMLGYINHEIRNPLNCINGMIDVSIIQYEEDKLINDIIDKEVLKDLITAKIACDLLGHIINDIIDLKGMSNGRLVINKTQINVDDFLRDFQRILSTRINEFPSVQFYIRNPERIKTIYFDEQRLFQILINFVTNALKHTESGTIILLLENSKESNADLETGKEDKIRISIIDTGVGIRRSEYDNIFQPFTQNNLNKTKGTGVGLGLHLCKMIIDQMNGKIGFTSEFGKGSTFYIEFNNN
jgi:signal transduction histidine kinase